MRLDSVQVRAWLPGHRIAFAEIDDQRLLVGGDDPLRAEDLDCLPELQDPRGP